MPTNGRCCGQPASCCANGKLCQKLPFKPRPAHDYLWSEAALSATDRLKVNISLEFAIRRGSTHQFPLRPKLHIWALAIVTWGNALRSSADRWLNGAARRGPSLPAVEEVGPAAQFPAAGRAFHLVLNATLLISIVKFGPLRTPRLTVTATWRCRDWRNHRCAWRAFAQRAAPCRPPSGAADPRSGGRGSAGDGRVGW